VSPSAKVIPFLVRRRKVWLTPLLECRAVTLTIVTITFTDEFAFTSMQLLSIFYMLRFIGSLINTHDDDVDDDDDDDDEYKKVKVKASHTRCRALGPELIPVYRQSTCR